MLRIMLPVLGPPWGRRNKRPYNMFIELYYDRGETAYQSFCNVIRPALKREYYPRSH